MEQYIEKCLISIKEQNHQNFEIIVIDDNSIDKTYEKASQFCNVIKTPIHCGAGASRNMGARISKGEILVFTDADCILSKEWLKRIDYLFKNNKNIVAVAGSYLNPVGNTFIEIFADTELKIRRENVPKYVATAPSNNFACYRNIFEKVNGFPENFIGASLEDMIFSFKINRIGKIYWDKYNGVYHHYKNTWKGYLKQQYIFGRDTVITYYFYPELSKIKTHQGRLIYFEAIISFLLFPILLLFGIKYFISLVLILEIINFKLCFSLYKKGSLPFLIKGIFLILIRDQIYWLSIIVGLIKLFKFFGKKDNIHR